MTPSLSPEIFRSALDALAARDSDLGGVLAAFGEPPMRRRDPGFATLVILILEQQVSLSSSRATYERLDALAGEMTPGGILALDEDQLRAAGLSRQKARYVRGLAETVADGGLALDDLAEMDDEAARETLTAITGIGTWTADVYLLAALGRPDIWPARDLALAVAAHEVKRLGARPDEGSLIALGETWRPWRAVAARILWHYYGNTKRNTGVRKKT